jgi:spore maturation protein CgeB
MRGSKKLRVLFLGDTSGASTAAHYYTNLVRLGHTVYPFNPDPFKPRSWLERWEMRASKKPPAAAVAATNAEVLRLCAENQFDLVFSMAQNYVSAQTLSEIRSVSKVSPILVYHSHDNNFSPGVLKPQGFEAIMRAYDVVFTTKSMNVEKYQALGQPQAYYLPSAFEPAVHHPISDTYSRFERDKFAVTFVGTYDRSREPLLDAVGWKNLHVWGDHWKKFPRFEHQRSNIYPKAVYFFEYSDILSHSQVVLGLLREEAGDRHTQRTFEIPACGALQIAPRNEEILSYFKEDKEIVCFSSNEELTSKVEFYLKHESKRREIAKKGLDRVLKGKHTYLDRVQSILKIAAKARAGSGERIKRAA